VNTLKQWVQLPHQWVYAKKLTSLSWQEHKAVGTAALLVLIPLAHRSDLAPQDADGWVKLPFAELTELTGISKPLLEPAFSLLEKLEIIQRKRPGGGKANLYRITPNQLVKEVETYAALPCRSMYSTDRRRLIPLKDFRLRSRAELDALKVFFLLVAMRDRKTNATRANYETISGYTGVHKNRIRTAISLLLNAPLIHLEELDAGDDPEMHTSHLYRIVGIVPRLHAGTRSTGAEGAD
jgi:hypothetical protein